ncbi:hypothetical protein, partial [Pseudonocardia sp. Ae331_Ps2]|uniref:hypothetical protein n=1 Tax=Pseudonocardia sp. Ae331_Ps2 TaxID=1885031 RepID=UPI001C37AB53
MSVSRASCTAAFDADAAATRSAVVVVPLWMSVRTSACTGGNELVAAPPAHPLFRERQVKVTVMTSMTATMDSPRITKV